MRSSSEIIRDLRQCLGETCQALVDMQDRCARYAEEIMMLREQLKEANHE